MGSVWQDAGNGSYEVDFSYTRAFPDLAGLIISEADLAPCSEEEANSVRAQREEAAECARKAAAEAAQAEMMRKPEIEELDTIRLTVPLKGADVLDDKAVYRLPVGSVSLFPLASAFLFMPGGCQESGTRIRGGLYAGVAQ